MSRYASKTALVEVIKDTLRAANLAPERLNFAAFMRQPEMRIIGDRHYGYTLADPNVNPVDYAYDFLRAGQTCPECDSLNHREHFA